MAEQRTSVGSKPTPLLAGLPADAAEGHAAAKAAYLSRFPQSAELFTFSDFSLFAILPDSIRFVGGFAQATTISPETLAEVLGEG
jgi:hypothetical protein